MEREVHVIKWGGENAGMLEDNFSIQGQKNIKRIIIVSAMRDDIFNTTTQLEKIAQILSLPSSSINDIEEHILSIENFHKKHLLSQGASQELLEKLNILFKDFRNHIQESIDQKSIPTIENDYTIVCKNTSISFLGFGEHISSFLNAEYMMDQGYTNVTQFVGFVDNKDFYENRERLGKKIDKKLKEKDIVFVPGYLSGTGGRILRDIGRGYSDATASLVALSMKDIGYTPILCIEKMVHGFMSADPRIVPDAVLCENLSYILAKEIITERGPEAKLLHYISLNRFIQQAEITVRVYNPFSNISGTKITRKGEGMPKGILFIGGVEDIQALVISSGRMEEGFIAQTSSIITETGINIKEPLGSATEQSYVFAGTDISLNDLIQDITKTFGLTAQQAGEYIDYRDELSLVYCVGNMKDLIGTLYKLTGVLKDNNINVKGITQGLEQRAIALVVERRDYKKTIQMLHKKLIER